MTEHTGHRARGTLALLGGWELTAASGRAISFPAHEKGRALLAYLATEDRWHYREKLGELLWPDSPAPRANLRQALSVLRAVLDDGGDGGTPYPTLLAQRNMIRFSPEASFVPDVAVFKGTAPDCCEHESSGQCAVCVTDLERMAARYHGEFMAGFSLPDCPEFEAWLQVKREAFHRRALKLLARLADWHETHGKPADALAHAGRYAELEPWDETGQRRLMRLHVAAGNSGAAIRQFEEYRAQLRAELGAAPGEAIRELYEQLCRQASRGMDDPAPQDAPAAPEPAQCLPERRHVAVLYCEMSVECSDPEEIVALLRAPRQRAIDLIHASGGYHAHSHGAGLLAYFGYPRSLEDAAVLAARAALAIARHTQAPVGARLGLHAGLTVTGAVSGVPDAAGQVSATAIRLCHAAEAGEIRLSDAAHELVSGYFHCERLQARPTHGSGPATGMLRLLDETGAAARLDAAACLAPLVGRKDELACLTALWRETCAGKGKRAVLLRGDPGIGKSRLIRHFATLPDIGPALVREMHCRREHQGSAFHPLGSYLAKTAQFAYGDSDGAKLGKLERSLGACCPGPDALPLLAGLLALEADGQPGMPALSPQQTKEGVIARLLQLLTCTAQGQALLLIVEDLHWADQSTLEWLERLLDADIPSPLLILLTARPECQPAWQDKVLPLDMPPLSGEEAAALVGLVDPAHSVPAATVARIVSASDGIPLFIEETTRMLMADAGTMRGGPAAIPASLLDLLAARLDRLEEARHLVRLCAAIGREFSSELLDAVTPLSRADTAAALRALEQSGLVGRSDGAGMTTYQFRHALIQEAAYQSQTREARREAHRRIAHALLAQSARPQGMGDAPEVLARHLSEAGDAREAVGWWRKAGAKAAGQGNVTEAIGHFDCALETMRGLPPDSARDALELSILVELGGALVSSKGYGSPEADRVYARAFALSETCGASLDLFRSIWGLYLGCSSRTSHADAMLMAEKLLRLARQDGDPALLITAHYACANSSYSLARFADTCRHLDHARRHYRPELDQRLLALFGEHTFVSALLFGAWASWTLGRPAQALEASSEAVSIARRVGHPQTMGFAYCLTGILHRLRGEPDRVREWAGALSGLAATHDFAFWQVTSDCLLGWAQAADGKPEGLARISRAIAAMRSGIFVGAVMYFLEMQAEACQMLARPQEQLRTIDEALGIMDAIHDRHFEAELYRLRGECLLQLSGDPGLAREWMERAHSVAAAQGAAELARRAAASLAKLPEIVQDAGRPL